MKEYKKEINRRNNNDKHQTRKKDFVITREFAAPRDLVWKVWTEQTHLEKWGSPQGFTMTCKKFEFKVGGENHYCQKPQTDMRLGENKILRNTSNA